MASVVGSGVLGGLVPPPPAGAAPLYGANQTGTVQAPTATVATTFRQLNRLMIM